jgi:hypothetical protein
MKEVKGSSLSHMTKNISLASNFEIATIWQLEAEVHFMGARSGDLGPMTRSQKTCF